LTFCDLDVTFDDLDVTFDDLDVTCGDLDVTSVTRLVRLRGMNACVTSCVPSCAVLYRH